MHFSYHRFGMYYGMKKLIIELQFIVAYFSELGMIREYALFPLETYLPYSILLYITKHRAKVGLTSYCSMCAVRIELMLSVK